MRAATAFGSWFLLHPSCPSAPLRSFLWSGSPARGSASHPFPFTLLREAGVSSHTLMPRWLSSLTGNIHEDGSWQG